MKIIDRKRIIEGDIASGEAGFALIIVMLVLVMMTILGLNSIMTSSTDIQISGNERVAAKTLSIADAGLNHAMRKLRGQDFDTLLTTATIANDGFVPLDFDPGVGIVNTISFDGGTYSISIRNNHMPGDSPQDTTPDIYKNDVDGYVIVRSEATYNGVTKIIEAEIRRIAADFPIVGGFGLVGALEEIDIDGNAFSISGNDNNPPGWPATTACDAQSGIAVSDAAAQTVINNTLTAQEANNINGVGGQGSGSVDVYGGFDAGGIQSTANLLMDYADRTITVQDDNVTMENISWGTYDNPQVTVVDFKNTDGERELKIKGNSTGYGILIINAISNEGGELDLRGNFSWYGVIIFLGYSEVELGAGGNIQIYGGMLVQNQGGGDPDNEVEIKGNTDIYYSCAAEQKAKNYSALVVNSWHEVSS